MTALLIGNRDLCNHSPIAAAYLPANGFQDILHLDGVQDIPLQQPFRYNFETLKIRALVGTQLENIRVY
jgi:hypothetical protein